MPVQRSVFLTGFMGSGKSTVGALLAERLSLEFVDLDSKIEAILGMPIAEIFEERGEPFFRRAEAAALRETARANPSVVALGGGAFENPDNRKTVRQAGVSVWLDLPWELAWERCENDSSRPLATDRFSFQMLFRKRMEGYRLADHRIDAAGREPDEIVQIILRRI